MHNVLGLYDEVEVGDVQTTFGYVLGTLSTSPQRREAVIPQRGIHKAPSPLTTFVTSK